MVCPLATSADLTRGLIETDLRVVVLDPNSDYTRMARVRKGTDRHLARRYRTAAAGVIVRSGTRGPGRLAVRMADLDPAGHPLSPTCSTAMPAFWSQTSAHFPPARSKRSQPPQPSMLCGDAERTVGQF